MLRFLMTMAVAGLAVCPAVAVAAPNDGKVLAKTAAQAFQQAEAQGATAPSDVAKRNPAFAELIRWADRQTYFCPVITLGDKSGVEIERWLMMNGYDKADLPMIGMVCRGWLSGFVAGSKNG